MAGAVELTEVNSVAVKLYVKLPPVKAQLLNLAESTIVKPAAIAYVPQLLVVTSKPYNEYIVPSSKKMLGATEYVKFVCSVVVVLLSE